MNAGARNFLTTVKWADDNESFFVHPKYSGVYPKQTSGRGARWGKAGQPVGHSGVVIRVKPVSGPIESAGSHRLRFAFNELAPATESARVTFMAFSEGNNEYRYTERVGMLASELCGHRIGEPQEIEFPAIGKLRVGETVELKARSNSGLPVSFHVAHGPTVIQDGKLAVSELPKRASFPITAKIVAYQFGRAKSPRIQTATPVEQTVSIVGP